MDTNKMKMQAKQKRKDFKPTRVIVGSFCVVIFVGTLLLCMPIASKQGSLSIINAFFTATSATCVTGLVVVDTFTQFTLFGQIIILLLIQIGGLGLVTLTSFFSVIVGKHMGFKSMRLASESISLTDASQAKKLLKFIITFALSIELIGAFFLGFVFVPQFGSEGVFISLFIAVSAFCNAGFDVFGRLGEYSSLTFFADNEYVLFIISILIISGGLGFVVWHDIAHYRQTRHLRTHTKLVLGVSAFLIVFGAVIIGLVEWDNPATLGAMPVNERISNALFQSITTRTAGFNSFNLNACDSVTKLFMIILMFIGAAPGGTGGGIKITTITVIMVAVFCVVKGREDAAFLGKRINHSTVYKSLAILFLSACIIVVSGVVIHLNLTPTAREEINSAFEAMSAFATVGLSMGVTAEMNDMAKIATMLTMLIGRVGPVSMAITLGNRKDKNQRTILPEAKIIVA